MLHYLFNIFVILFFYAETDLYRNSWIKVDKESNLYQFHKKNAKSVFDIKEKFCTKNKDASTNVAYIGISVSTGKEVLSFPICKRVICSSHTSDVYTEDTKSKMVVIPDLIIPSQPDGYNPMMAESNVERKFFAFIKLLSKLQTKGYNTYTFHKFITKIIDDSKMVNKSLDQISGHDTSIDDMLKFFLHCEQIILLHILNNTSLFQEVLKTNRETIPDGGKIQKITLDIITYNDMCPKCFATCECFFNELKTNILNSLCPKCNFDDIQFQIIVSSLQPYEIKKDTFTRKSINKSDDQNKKIEFDIILDAELKHCTGNREDIQGKIIQFVNPWLMELYFGNVFNKINVSIQEAQSLPILEKLLDSQIIPLKNIQERIRAQNNPDDLLTALNTKAEELRTSINDFIKKVNDKITNSHKEEQKSEQSHQQDEKEFEHNNNTEKKN